MKQGATPYAYAIERIIVPAAIVFFLYNPHFSDGELKFLESGYHLGNINAIFHGMIPYRDFFCLYGPLSAWVPSWIMSVGDPSLAALRGYFHVSDILGMIVAYFLLLTVVRNRFLVFFGLVILVLETHHLFWTTRWGGFRGGIGLLVPLCLFIAMKSKRERVWMGLAGVCCACGILYSTEVGMASGLAVMVYLCAGKLLLFQSAERMSTKAAPFAVGFLIVSAVFIIYSLTQSMFMDYVRITFYEIPFNHFRKFRQDLLTVLPPQGKGILAIAKWIAGSQAKVWIAGLCFLLSLTGVMSFRKVMYDPVKEVRTWVLLGYGIPLWLLSFRAPAGPQVASSLTVAIMLWLMFAEQLWLSARLLLTKARASAGDRRSPEFGRAVVCIVIIVVGMAYWLGSQKQNLFAPQFLARLVQQKFTSPPDLQPLNDPRMGSSRLPAEQAKMVQGIMGHLHRELGPEDSLFVFPDMAIFWFLSDRKSMGRFPVPLMAALTEGHARELLQTLNDQPPDWIVYNPRQSELAGSVHKKEEDLMPEVVNFIRENYEVVDTCEGVEIMVRKGKKEIHRPDSRDPTGNGTVLVSDTNLLKRVPESSRGLGKTEFCYFSISPGGSFGNKVRPSRHLFSRGCPWNHRASVRRSMVRAVPR